jgi:hypothetical protein
LGAGKVRRRFKEKGLPCNPDRKKYSATTKKHRSTDRHDRQERKRRGDMRAIIAIPRLWDTN